MLFAVMWIDYHSMQSKSERERQIPYDTVYTWNLKYDTNEPNRHREQIVVTKESGRVELGVKD